MYTTNPISSILSIHFLNDQNIVQELSADEKSVSNPIPSLSLLNKVNKDLEDRIEKGNKNVEEISNEIALSVGGLSDILSGTNLSVENLSGLLN